MEKKNEQLSVHLPETLKKQVLTLANDRELTISQFVCFLIEDHLEVKRSEYRLLQQVFDFERTDRDAKDH